LATRVSLELSDSNRDIVLVDTTIDSKLRGCGCIRMKVVNVMASGHIKERVSVPQSKTLKPVGQPARRTTAAWAYFSSRSF